MTDRTTTTDDTEPTDSGSPDIAEIEADIERTRDDLAQTVDQLAAKLDVKTRVRNRVVEVKDDAVYQARTLRDRATDDQGRPTPTTTYVAGALAVVVLAVVVLSVRRRR
jgi:hypothetical protein